jgi:hypothetical protein
MHGDWLPLGRPPQSPVLPDPAGSYNTESLIAFLDDLKRHLRR